MKKHRKSIGLDQETYDNLEKVRKSLKKSWGFLPTYRETVIYLINLNRKLPSSKVRTWQKTLAEQAN